MAKTPAEVAYEHAVHAMDGTGRSVDAIRTGATALLGSGVIAASFLGSVVLRDGLGAWASIAIALFVAHVGLVAVVLWPRAWKLHFKSADLVKNYADNNGDVQTMYRELAKFGSQNATASRDKINHLAKWTMWSIAVLVLELLAWAIAL